MEQLHSAFSQLSSEAAELYLGDKIPAVDVKATDFTPLRFYRDFVAANRPVKLLNAIDHWPALSSWDEQYLVNNIGEDTVSVTVTPNGFADAITDGVFMLPEEQAMSFENFIKLLHQNKDKEVFYIQKQNSNMTDEFKRLMDDVDTDIPWATHAFGCKPDAVNFWMGDKRAVTSMHKDHYENIYCVVRGTKTFTIIPPTDQPYVPYVNVEVFKYKQIQDGTFSKVKVDGCDRLPWIPIDPLVPDLDSYPDFAKAHVYTAEVSEGEVLYLPSLWYHHVTQTHGCIAVNYWYDMKYDIRYNYYQFVGNLLKGLSASSSHQ